MTLLDAHARAIDYLRVSVTDRCDLRCSYCMPKGFRDFAARDDRLSAGELERLVGLFARLGVRRVRLTGGEPLTRGDIVDIASRLGRLPGVEDLSLSTNATRLATHAHALRRAGVQRLNVSLDTLDRARFAEIAGQDRLPQVLAGLAAARAAGFAPIKLNMVLLPGENDAEVQAMVAFCIENGFILRFIETMPIGEAGRDAGYLDLRQVEADLQRRFDLVAALVPGGGPARYLRTGDGRVTIGFITPRSRHFCATCNRVRLAADGTLHLCLGREDRLALRPLLRCGAGDGEIEAAIRAALARKPERHRFGEEPQRIVRLMAQTGG